LCTLQLAGAGGQRRPLNFGFASVGPLLDFGLEDRTCQRYFGLQLGGFDLTIQNRKLAGLVAFVLAFALCGAVAQAQQPKKVPRIGYLSNADPALESTRSETIRLALRELGYKDRISPRSTDMRRESSIGSLSLRPS
jgi:hypothetical protein